MANEKEKSSVLKDAILESKQIFELAKKKLVEGHSKELNEMITKLLNENSISVNEPEMVKEESLSTETGKNESAMAGNPEVVDMKEASLKEIEDAFNAATDEDEFKVVKTDDNNGGENFSLQDIEGAISEVMSEIEAAENAGQPHVEAGAQQPEGEGVQAVEEEDTLTKFKKLHEEMGKMIEAMNSEKSDMALKEAFHQKMTEMMGEGYEKSLDETHLGKMYETFKSKMKSQEDAVSKQSAEAGKIQENESTFMPKSSVPNTHNPESAAKPGAYAAKPVEKPLDKAVKEEKEISVDTAKTNEAHGIGLSSNKLVSGDQTPRLDHKEYAQNKVRLALQKEGAEKLQKRINTLVNENFKVTTALNKSKTDLDTIKKLNEKYKVNQELYRKQLNEMALVSANIANFNNVLLNESLALSFEEKKAILDRFTKATTFDESEKTYKAVIKEYSEQKKTIKETVEQTIAKASVGTSSSEVIKEGVEKGVNILGEHVAKIKRLSNYVPAK